MVSALSIGGCAAAVVGGGAGAIAYTNRGAEAQVKGDLDTVAHQTRSVFQEMGIQTSEAKAEPGKKQELRGETSKFDVTVSITPDEGDTSHVEVIAREGTIKWNKDYAKQILSEIVEQG